MRREDDMTTDLAIAEAAAWLARLQGEGRTPATEAAFKDWLADPAHAKAFSRATETWEIIPGAAALRPERAARPMHHSRPRLGRRGGLLAPALVAATLIVAVVGAGAAFLARDPVYATAVGHQQSLTLDDGTRVALNTGSRLVVDYSRATRRVRLERGEAMFEVIKDARRPFIVVAGDEQVRALGTAFVVRRDRGRVAVVLVEGRVEVSRKAQDQAKPVRLAVLSPGERLTVRADAGVALDRPKLEAATAWRRGQVMFDDSSLIDAVAELNRYGGAQVVVGDPSLAGLRVSGVFAAQDPDAFAEAVAQLHGLRREAVDDRIVLRR